MKCLRVDIARACAIGRLKRTLTERVQVMLEDPGMTFEQAEYMCEMSKRLHSLSHETHLYTVYLQEARNLIAEHMSPYANVEQANKYGMFSHTQMMRAPFDEDAPPYSETLDRPMDDLMILTMGIKYPWYHGGHYEGMTMTQNNLDAFLFR